MEDLTISLQKYLDSSKITSILTAVALLLILITLISPFNITGWKLFSSKAVILIILAYVAYNIFCNTTDIMKNTKDIFMDTSLIPLRNNMLLSYLYMIVILVLFFYICKTLFD
jgi:hypothetical protein